MKPKKTKAQGAPNKTSKSKSKKLLSLLQSIDQRLGDVEAYVSNERLCVEVKALNVSSRKMLNELLSK